MVKSLAENTPLWEKKFVHCCKLRKNSSEIVDELFCSFARRRLFHMTLCKSVQTNSANLWAVIAEIEFKEFNDLFLMFSLF